MVTKKDGKPGTRFSTFDYSILRTFGFRTAVFAFWRIIQLYFYAAMSCSTFNVPSGFAVIRVTQPFSTISITRLSPLMSHTLFPLKLRTVSIRLTSFFIKVFTVRQTAYTASTKNSGRQNPLDLTLFALVMFAEELFLYSKS